jgi:3-oxoacyl-[acyl-carrier protein] reductase
MSGVALVTGGAGGICQATARRLVASGYTVLAGDLAAADLAGAEGKDITARELDVSDPSSVAAYVAAGAELGEIRALVNCAGIVRFTPLDDFDDAEASRVWEVNVAGAARVTAAAAPHMPEGSAIVNLSSLTGAIGRLTGASMYGASKAGVDAMTRYLACELAPRGIRVNALAPGYIRVPMSPSMQAVSGGDDEVVKQVPLGRLGEPEEMAEIIEFLLSDRASYITGTTLYADGGVVAR